MSNMCCFHVCKFSDVSGCNDDIEGFHSIVLPLLRDNLEFQNTSELDTQGDGP